MRVCNEEKEKRRGNKPPNMGSFRKSFHQRKLRHKSSTTKCMPHPINGENILQSHVSKLRQATTTRKMRRSINKTQTSGSLTRTSQQSPSKEAKSSKKDRASPIETIRVGQVLIKDKGNGEKDKVKSDRGTYV